MPTDSQTVKKEALETSRKIWNDLQDNLYSCNENVRQEDFLEIIAAALIRERLLVLEKFRQALFFFLTNILQDIVYIRIRVPAEAVTLIDDEAAVLRSALAAIRAKPQDRRQA